MKVEKHYEVLKEVLDEIDSALKDPRGLVAHQRRIAFSLSLGSVNLFEIYFHKNNVIKEGLKINHRWFKWKKEKLMNRLQEIITTPVSSLENIDKIIDLIIKLEEKRDDLAYGSPSSDKVLQEKINLFFELKELIEWKLEN